MRLSDNTSKEIIYHRWWSSPSRLQFIGSYMSNDPEISIVVPIYNEAPLLPELFFRLSSVVSALTAKYELILVNDGSQDGSLLLLQEFSQRDVRVKYLSFSRNFGHQVAIMAGLDHAAGKAVVIIDGDLQDPPELIEAL